MFERAFGFEQRRDIDFVLDTEQPRKIQRGKDRGGLFAFGHQHADRRVAIDMVEDLRHREELADRGRVFDRQRGEVRAQRRYRFEQRAHADQRSLAAQIEPVIGIDAAADGVMQLRAVHPEMDSAHAQPISAHAGGERQQSDGARRVGATGLLL